MSTSLGSLVVSLAANTSEFTADLGKAAHLASKDMDDIVRSAKKVGAALGAVTAAAATTAAVFIKTTIDQADAMGKLAQRVGVSVESLSSLKYAADLSDVSMEALSIGLKQLNKNIDEGDPSFKRLGISLVDSTGKAKTTEQVLRDVADSFAKMQDGSAKTAISMELFGKSGADLITLLNGGTKALDDYTLQAKRAAVVITEETARAAADFNDNVTRLNTALQGVGMTMANPVIRNLGLMTNQIIAASDATNSWTDAIAIGFHWQPVTEQIVNITAKLESLANQRAKLAAENGKGSFFGFLTSDNTSAIANIDHTIATLQARMVALQKVRTDINNADNKPPPDGAPPPRFDKDAAANAARRAAAAERERQAALRESMNLMAAQTKVELDSYTELRKIQGDAMAAAREELERKKEISESSVEQIRKSLMSEQELLADNYLNQQDQLVAARDLAVVTQEQYNELMQGLEVDHWAKLAAINNKGLTDREKFSEMSLKNQAKTIFGELADITAGVAQHNRALFEANKVAGIANAIINAYEGISLTMSKYPFPFNVALAAAHGLAAFAQVKAIQGAQFGGGGAAPSLAGGTAGTPVTQVTGGVPPSQGSGQTTVVHLSGSDLYSDKAVRELLKRIKETTDKGGKLVIS